MSFLITLLSVALNLGFSEASTFKILSAKAVAHSLTGLQRNYMVGAGFYFMEEEIWKDVIGYVGYYKVSSLGTIKSLSRIITDKNGRVIQLSESIKKISIDNDGYFSTTLSKDSTVTSYKVHRIVAMAFIQNPENKPQINHKNGIRTDNRVTNLEWCTPSENVLHSYQENLRTPCWLNKFGKDNASSKPVNQLDMSGKFIQRFNGMAEAERITGIDHSQIAAVCRGKRRVAKGFKWEYA